MESSRRHPHLIEAETWANEHKYLLTRCFERFQGDGEWPTLEQLQHDFEVAGREEDVSRVAWAMPGLLGSPVQQRLELLVRALLYVPAATALLEDWCSVVKLSYDRWFADPTAEITRADVLHLLDGDPRRTRLVSILFQRDSWPFAGGYGGPDDDWSRKLNSEVRPARNATSAAEILAARDAVSLSPLPPREASGAKEEEPAQKRHLIKTAWELISENQLLAAVISGVILLAIGYYFFRPTETTSPPSDSSVAPPANVAHAGPLGRQAKREQAGTGGARTFSEPSGSAEGARVQPNQHILVVCRVYKPEPESVNPDGYWYKLASSPWNGRYYAPANSFWNGDIPGHKPYTHYTDFSVPPC
jgi:hypothetical protein